ncbi:phage DNA encapsidation protein [endosymbiont GvMRE of Glomus versiforme]|uniref:phage DNA encapsidation protein n=1 Tax=endosymbiont GvMRE of Glomus versiforme TaxID=2039283 RepID=UPI000EEFAE4C|nr:phage DNA encapsidation protein [endosymbiont GvMRE of Glomus versiforme]RHZ36345.1 hypothetical protein GvMRE_Ic1g50 [endosymbiont GvMRE of Glomus versiforme]RHZ37756.1 hypothetical protein GvMRE_I1g692 [endosymbiont GvMRE of Glomus versiforme]
MNKQDKRYQRLQPVFNHLAKTKIIIWGRASGKSYSTKYRALTEIENQQKEFIWLRRQFDSIRTGSLESWKRVIANYCLDNKVPEKDIELVWDAITRGVKYKNTMKCFMVELFSSYKSRENYTQTISEIIFDEAIINPKTGESYLDDEEGKIKELIGSAWRDRSQPAPKLTYIANPYERFRPFMASFLPVIRKQLTTLKKRVFSNEVVNLENEQGELLSLYKPTSCQKENECKCIDENCVEVWNGFFAKEEDLKITEFINGSIPKYVFMNCILYQAKKGFLFFCHKENKEISNKEEIKNIPEWYVNNEGRLKSKQVYKVPVEEDCLKEDLLYWWESGKLFFCADGSREVIMEFMEKGKITKR